MSINNKNFIVYKKKVDRFFSDSQSHVMGTFYTPYPHQARKYKTMGGAIQRLFNISNISWYKERHVLNWCVKKKYYFSTGKIREMKIGISEGTFGLKELIDSFGIVYTVEYKGNGKYKLINSNDKVFEYLNKRFVKNRAKILNK